MNAKPRGSGVDFRTVEKCRICQSRDLTEFFNLDAQPLANAFLSADKLAEPEPAYPLRVLFCQSCSLVLLGEVVDPGVMFSQYVYFSSGMPASKHFRDYATSLVSQFIQAPEDLFLEIGSNDGHFLEVVKERHPRILGVDPAQNIAEIANRRGVSTIPDFFSASLAQEIVKKHGPAKVIAANNVVAHIDDHHDLARGIATLLAPDGVFVFEAPYLVDMFKNLTFDTIYHEHLSYLAVRPLISLFQKFGLEIFRVESHPVQGVSLRVFVAKDEAYRPEASVDLFIGAEKQLKLDEIAAYLALAREIEKLKAEVVALLRQLKSQGKRIAAYGASAKGNTLLNYFGIGPDVLDYATEALPSKIGLYTPGMHLPVVDIAEARPDPPDYYLLLAWNYLDVVLKKEETFRRRGGKFILPVGRERII